MVFIDAATSRCLYTLKLHVLTLRRSHLTPLAYNRVSRLHGRWISGTIQRVIFCESQQWVNCWCCTHLVQGEFLQPSVTCAFRSNECWWSMLWFVFNSCLATAHPTVHLSQPGVHFQTCAKALNAELRNVHQKRWQPSIKGGLRGNRNRFVNNGKSCRCPCKSERSHWDKNVKKPRATLTTSRRPERVVRRGSFHRQITMLILTCGWRWLSCNTSEAGGRSRGLNAERGVAGIIYNQLPNNPPPLPERSPFPRPPIGRLITLSPRQWPILHVILWAGKVRKSTAPAEMEITCS